MAADCQPTAIHSLLLFLLLLAGVPGWAAAAADDGFHLTPYLWYAGFEGSLGTDATDAGGGASVDFGKLWDNMSLAGAMLNASWRRDRWTAFGDWTYARVESDSPTSRGQLYAGAHAEVRGNIMQAFAGWDALPSATGHLDLFAGLRYYDVDLKLHLEGAALQNLDATGDAQWWDAVAGVRFLQHFAGRWQAYGQADVGAGGSEPAWELIASVGYDFDWGALLGGWRYLSSDYRDDSLEFDARLTGPFLGASFRF